MSRAWAVDQLVKDGRADIHQQVDRHGLPVSHTTRRTGRPFTLVLTKTRALFQREAELTVPPRDAKTFDVPAGHFFRIVSVEGPQVGDLNLWNVADLSECFYSGKTRALHASHVTTGDRLWSKMPHLRPMATITHDTLEW